MRMDSEESSRCKFGANRKARLIMNESKVDPIVIIGAGMAGLTAGRLLREAGLPVLVLDKGRGVGGRMATRRIGHGRVDHGAQYFTVRDKQFAQRVSEWREAGVVSEWGQGFADARGKRSTGGHFRYHGVDGMTTLPKHLAEGLDIRLQTRITEIIQEKNRWSVQSQSGETFRGRALLLTPPVPQSLELLDAGQVSFPSDIRRDLERIDYDPCLALLAVFAGASRILAPGGLRFSEGPIAWMADNHQKGISPDAHTVTIHAAPDYSRRHWRTNAIVVAQKLLEAAAPWLHPEVLDWQIHRWRYSQPVATYPEQALFLPGPPPLVFAGDAFGGPRVEGAVLSGYAAGQTLLAAKDR
jgi:predicted NAD/FAD-dependent oxidoreductase